MAQGRRRSRANRRNKTGKNHTPERRSKTPPELDIEIHVKDTNLLVTVKNPIVAGNCYTLRNAINKALSDATITSIIINMQGVPYADSTALRVFLELHRQLKRQGKKLILYRVIRRIRKVLEILNIDKVFDLRDH